MTPVALFLLMSARDILRHSLMLLGGIFMFAFAFVKEPRIRNQPPLRSKWKIALWRIGYATAGLAMIIVALWPFQE